jgi:aminoglycoside phosphotransferase (APT) family kinase protein
MTPATPPSSTPPPATEVLAREILVHSGFAKVQTVSPIDVGFSNDLFLVDDAYVLKIGKSPGDQPALMKEVYFCDLFADRICAPKVLASDTSMRTFALPYIVYSKLPGVNLYTRWHEYSNEQRKELVRQICHILRIINSTPFDDYVEQFRIDTAVSWHDRICARIEERAAAVADSGTLGLPIIEEMRSRVSAHHESLRQEKMGLTFYDPHFDNFLVSDGNIVGILDFERTELMSIDYVLDLVARMVKYPKKYVCEHYEHLIVDADYAHLLDWYREFYPELFAFDRLDERLTIYLIDHSLSDIYYFPAHPTAPTELMELLRQN